MLFSDDGMELLLVVEHLNTLCKNSIKRGRMIAQLKIVLTAPYTYSLSYIWPSHAGRLARSDYGSLICTPWWSTL